MDWVCLVSFGDTGLNGGTFAGYPAYTTSLISLIWPTSSSFTTPMAMYSRTSGALATGPDSQPVRLDCVPTRLVSRANEPDGAGSATDCVDRETNGRKRGTDARATRPDCAGKDDNPRSFSLAFSEKCAPPNRNAERGTRNAERGTRNAERGTRGRKGAPSALCAINNLTGGTSVIGTHGNEPGHERQARFIISGHACRACGALLLIRLDLPVRVKKTTSVALPFSTYSAL